MSFLFSSALVIQVFYIHQKSTHYRTQRGYTNSDYFVSINSSLCFGILRGENNSIESAKSLQNMTRVTSFSDSYFADENNTINHINLRNHDNVVDEEASFPLAFIILLYKDVEQTVRLLKAIYRPQNLYCIHVDASASAVTHDAIKVVVSFYNNVFVASKTVDVIYGHISRLKAELNCMSDLINKNNTWMYAFNLPSQQFPLKTNIEMVRIIKKYNGSNLIEGITTLKRKIEERYSHRYKIVDGKLIKTKVMKVPYKFNNQSVNIVKGSAIGGFSRSFVQFVLKSEVSRTLLEWMEDIHSPDEYFWATLNFNPQLLAPGHYKGNIKFLCNHCLKDGKHTYTTT